MRFTPLMPLAALVLCSTAAAQTPVFTKIADTATVAPGSSGTFSVFADARDISAGKVAFMAYHSAGGSGIYSFANGVLKMEADNNTAVPGTTDTFQTFFGVSVDGGVVAFTGGWPGPGGGCAFNGSEGVFAKRLGAPMTPIMLQDSLTTVDHCFHGVELMGSVVLYAGGVNPVDSAHNHSESIKATTISSPPIPLFDTATLKPSGAPFVGYDQDFFFRNNQLLLAEILPNTFGAVAGLYLATRNGPGPQVVADSQTAVPSGSGNFSNFASADFDGNEVAFVGRDSGNATALYAGTNPSNLRLVAGRTTQVPGEVFNFSGLSNPCAFDSGVMLFSGYWGGGNGLFMVENGVITELLRKGDVLDGRVVEQAFCRPGNKSGDFLIVDVRFAGFSPALYLVTL